MVKDGDILDNILELLSCRVFQDYHKFHCICCLLFEQAPLCYPVLLQVSIINLSQTTLVHYNMQTVYVGSYHVYGSSIVAKFQLCTGRCRWLVRTEV